MESFPEKVFEATQQGNDMKQHQLQMLTDFKDILFVHFCKSFKGKALKTV